MNVPDFCTCGAQLPPDARFCHKCGKPQRDEPVEIEETVEPAVEEIPVAPAAIAPEPTAINLANRAAVRAALFSGLAAFFLSAPLGALGLFVLVGGGALAVFLYRRSTGQVLSMANGARLGWITGIFLFVLLLLTFTASFALQPTFMADLQKEISSRSSLPEAEVRQVIDVLSSPVGIIAMLLGMFLSSTLPPALGGAVGAKLLSRD